MRRTMNWSDIYDSVGQEIGFQHSEIAETVAEILARIPEDRRPDGMRVIIDCHQLKIEHDEVDDEVKSIIAEAIEAANPMIPKQFAVFRFSDRSRSRWQDENGSAASIYARKI